MLYKPYLAERLHELLVGNIGPMEMSLTCCKHVPPLIPGTQVVNICPGCDRRYRENYEDSGTISLWEVLVENTFLSLPDYDGREMTGPESPSAQGAGRVEDSGSRKDQHRKEHQQGQAEIEPEPDGESLHDVACQCGRVGVMERG